MRTETNNAQEMINELSRMEIEQLRNRANRTKKETRNCLWCDKEKEMRSDQKFCSPRCKTAYSMGAARVRYERLLAAERLWEQERTDFVKEVRELKKEIAELRARSQ